MHRKTTEAAQRHQQRRAYGLSKWLQSYIKHVALTIGGVVCCDLTLIFVSQGEQHAVMVAC